MLVLTHAVDVGSAPVRAGRRSDVRGMGRIIVLGRTVQASRIAANAYHAIDERSAAAVLHLVQLR